MKQQTKDIIHFLVLAIWSGVAIGIGGTASLYANNLYGTYGKLIGGALFSLGIFLVIAFGLKLFTGMVARIPELGKKAFWQLPLCFIGNTVGILLVVLIVSQTALGNTLKTQATTLMTGKLNADNALIKNFFSAMMCGFLITFSVRSPEFVKEKGLSASVGAMFPILVFAFCGFDHSVANMMYFFLYGEFSGFIFSYILITILGNLVGGVLLPICLKVFKSEK